MYSLDLDKVLTGHVFGFVMIFARVGSTMMLLPGFGETYVSPRIRLMLAFAVSFLLLGPLMPIIPAPPAGVPDLLRVLAYEIVIGLFIGSITRLLMSTLETIGMIIAIQTGLSNAVILNPALATQSPLPSALLSIIGLTLVFTTGLDHFLLRSLFATYDLFPPGGSMPVGDMAKAYAHTFSQSFLIGVELGMPYMVIGLLMYVALGLMQRLMPQVQLFLVMLPVQIWGGLFLLAITIGTIMSLWLHYFDQSMGELFAR
jgi:flagellar biosynthetic protein FliR